ncbi:hypothetical protein [Paenibacillus puerhi]|uniref:hypothetical protein n=1 Tax=Paenibacillus puerhi TaxID=2692622 RepID=UPI00135A5E2E|nr:hypothetical protein [Paenibacillus puerhi]
MTFTKQTIGNRGAHPHTSALPSAGARRPHYGGYGARPPVQTRALTPSGYGDIGALGNYPGLGAELPVQQAAFNPQVLPPAQGGGGALSGLGSLFGGGGSAAGGSGSSFNIQQVKQLVDRLGGIDGIVDTFGKMQKMVQSVQQMAPMIKLLMGSFGKGRKAAAAEEEIVEERRPRRRRRRRRKSGARKARARR